MKWGELETEGRGRMVKRRQLGGLRRCLEDVAGFRSPRVLLVCWLFTFVYLGQSSIFLLLRV